MSEGDLELVLEWRNHPDIRMHMYQSDVIALAEHRNWFRSAEIDPDRKLLIFEVDGAPVGYVNFKLMDADEAIWGFYCAPGSPRGTGALLGEAALSYAFGSLAVEKVWGEVLPQNAASQRFHLRQGFELEAMISYGAGSEHEIKDVRRYLLTKTNWLGRSK